MSAATLALIIQGIQAGIAAAPQIEAVAIKGKEFITSLFEGGVITKAQQDATHAHIDAVAAAVKSGGLPPEWSVEADPQ